MQIASTNKHDTMKSKPTFFISSTIYDFADLRSAIKYYLEQQGCVVLASEFNDFGQPLDEHSYGACLKQIQVADYFVLLIGSRIGGWYDKGDRISITRQEFRAAYELHAQGQLKIITFVRADVWTVKEDRKVLVKYLEKLDLNDAAKQQISNAPSKAVEDAQFIIDFLEEVGRNKETAEAAKSGEPPPSGNWIYSFSKFEDVISVLQSQVFAGLAKVHAANRRILRNELLRMLTSILSKSKEGKTCFPEYRIDELAKKYPIQGDDIGKKISIERHDLEMLFMIMVDQSRKISTLQVIERVLATDTFLEYDDESGNLREHPIYDALISLQSEVFDRNNFDRKLISEIGLALQAHPKVQKIAIPALQLLPIQGLFDRSVNIVRICKAILLHFDGNQYVAPKLRHRSPITDQKQQLDHERVAIADVENFINQ